jgi:hypothetical protein
MELKKKNVNTLSNKQEWRRKRDERERQVRIVFDEWIMINSLGKIVRNLMWESDMEEGD